MISFLSLQGLSTLVTKQQLHLKGLIDTYSWISDMKGLLNEQQIQSTVKQAPCAVSDAFIMTEAKGKLFAEGLGVWSLRAIDSMVDSGDGSLYPLVITVCCLFVNEAAGISKILENEGSNVANDALPPVLPVKLSRIKMRDLVKTIQVHSEQLNHIFNADGIEHIGEDFCLFLQAFWEEPLFKSAVLENTNPSLSFKESWSSRNNQFLHLQEFYGGLTSAFLNTAAVEANFSIHGWEKDDTRTNLTDFSLEGIFHSKQYKELQKLSHDL